MSTMSPLHERFAAQGAVFEDRNGYDIAVRTIGNKEEADAIRNGIGVWDASDLGKIMVRGGAARELLDRTLTGDIEGLYENAIRYTLLLDEDGRIVADVQVYNNFDEFMVTCSAGSKARVLKALEANNSGGAEITDASDKQAVICIEGPKAWQVPQKLAGLDVRSLRLLTFTECEISGAKVLLARIGYCGEYGYTLFVPREAALAVLDTVLERAPEAVPCGRDVQDLLRLEVRSFNLEKDIPNGESPLQAGLHWMIHFRKSEFVGREAIMREKQLGVTQKLVAFEVLAENSQFSSSDIRDGADVIGRIVNFAYSERRGRPIGLAYLAEAYGWPGVDLLIHSENGEIPIHTVSAPFIHTESNRIQIS